MDESQKDMQLPSQYVQTPKLTQTYKAILASLYRRETDFERESMLGPACYGRCYNTARVDLGRQSGKTTAAAEFTRDNHGVLLVTHTESQAVMIKRQYRIGNVMSLNQYRHGHSGLCAGLSMVIFDECQPASLPLFVKVALLGGSE